MKKILAAAFLCLMAVTAVADIHQFNLSIVDMHASDVHTFDAHTFQADTFMKL